MQRTKRSHQHARIRVAGIGSGGRTAVNRLIASGAYGVDFVALDTDTEALRESLAPLVVRLSKTAGDSRGAAGRVKRGKEAALASSTAIGKALQGSDLVFVLAGLGGGTGSGAAPVVSQIARREGALVIGIVTYPFSFEGPQRSTNARNGIVALQRCTDTLIVIPNDRLLNLSKGRVGFHETYRLAQGFWGQSIQGISDLVNHSGLINVDFADVRSIMAEGGAAIIASGRGRGKDRARKAAASATRSNLLGVTIDGAHGVLFNVVGGPDMNLLEIEEAAETITARVHPKANVIFGAAINGALEDEIRITVIATGFDFKKPGGPVIHQASGAVDMSEGSLPWQLEPAHFGR
ncbi:MAG: cell division protein FtsZ [Chloroflexota bacterium]|nr:MAG: cell division protein FtsZ [Chloroflexota bacterium]